MRIERQITFDYSIARSFLDDASLSSLTSEIARAVDDVRAKKIGSNIVQLNSYQIEESEIFGRVLGKIVLYFSENLGVSGFSLAKVWLVETQPTDIDPTKLPYFPHFDRHRYLKAMVYLHDVDEDHGPIHFGNSSNPSAIEYRRRRLPTNYKEFGLNGVKSSEMESFFEPVLGKAGDAIFFDTNTPHSAGIVRDGFERRVIRFDFDVPGWNPRGAFLSRFVKFLWSRSHKAE